MILTVLFCPFLANIFLYFDSLLEGTLILAFALMPLNAFFPMDFMFLDLIVIVFRFLHPWKALAFILVLFLISYYS